MQVLLAWGRGNANLRYLFGPRSNAKWGELSVDFDGDALAYAVLVDSVAPEPPPRSCASADYLRLVGCQDGALPFGQGGDDEADRTEGGGIPDSSRSIR